MPEESKPAEKTANKHAKSEYKKSGAYSQVEQDALLAEQAKHSWNNLEFDYEEYKNKKSTLNSEPEHVSHNHDWTLPDLPQSDVPFCLDRSLGPIDESYFTLSVAYYDGQIHDINNSFTEHLSSALNRVYLTYETWFGKAFLQKANIQLIIAASDNDYLTLLEERDIGHLSSLTGGVYIPTYNIAFVNRARRGNEFDDFRTMRVAIHESVHAINFALFGFTSRWINEGLAEFFESYIDPDKTPDPINTKTWIRRAAGEYVPAPLDKLIYSSTDWIQDQDSVHYLYASSWSYIHFLQQSTQGRQVLADLLSVESSSPCSIQEPSLAITTIEEQIPDIYFDYNTWFYNQVDL